MTGWITYGPRCVRPFESAALYSEARKRVLASPRLSKYLDIILSDGYASDEDHLRWVIRGKVGEIVAWAEQIRGDSAQDS